MARWLRIRGLLDRWFGVLVVAFLVVALAGGWLAYQGHIEPGTTTEQQTVSTWNVTGTVAHSASVRSTNPVYEVGERLHDRPIYFREATPVLDGTVSFVYGASEGGTLDVDVTRRISLQSVEDTRERTLVVWERIHETEQWTTESVDPGSPVEAPFSVNVSRMMNLTERVDEDLDSPPGQPRLVVNTTFGLSGTVNNRSIDRTETYPVVVEFDGSNYRVVANATSERFESTRAIEVPRSPGLVQLVGGPVLLLVGFVGAGGLLAARTQNWLEVTDIERERLAYEDDREDFEEWISTIQLPDEVLDRPRARADSLGSLVDFAIDTDNGVIEDLSRGLYCVVHHGTLYTYRPPDKPAGTTAFPVWTDGTDREAPTEDQDEASGDEDEATGDEDEATGDQDEATGDEDEATGDQDEATGDEDEPTQTGT